MPHPPKPRVVIQKPAVDVVSMEQTISGLRTENVELKKQINESQSVIVGLRRDLTGASARLSDITGERRDLIDHWRIQMATSPAFAPHPPFEAKFLLCIQMFWKKLAMFKISTHFGKF